jgi:hypothetical protein
MAQEFVWPLALAYALPIPGNRFHGQETIRRWAIAGMHFAARTAHRDGSCDDYFPFERAVGASAFSLLGALESARLLGHRDDVLDRFFRRRAAWLAQHREAGRLANHEALTALCLRRASTWLDDRRLSAASDRRLERLLSWQDPEGWFQEYDGADLGYQTLTIWALAEMHREAPRPATAHALEAAVGFAAAFIHPDGSWGGEYGSRNTYAFYPAGFEIAGAWLPEALTVNDRVIAGMAAGRDAVDDEDHLLAHRCWNLLLAWQEWRAPRPVAHPVLPGRRHFPNAGLLVDRRAGNTLIVALAKGGSFRHFGPNGRVTPDTGPSILMKDGRNAVAHLHGRYETEVHDDRIVVSGEMHWAKHGRMTVARSLVLRCFMILAGRFFPNLVRALLQRLLITGGRPAGFAFRREFAWTGSGWTIKDRISGRNWQDVRSVLIGTAETSIYVAMSRTFQDAQLHAPEDLTGRLAHVRSTLEAERRL